MNDSRDLQLVLDSGTPLVAIETTDEQRVLDILKTVPLGQRAKAYRPLFRWTITDGRACRGAARLGRRPHRTSRLGSALAETAENA
jgi:hypothetical protein